MPPILVSRSSMLHPRVTSISDIVNCYMRGAHLRFRCNLDSYRGCSTYSDFIHYCCYGVKETLVGYDGPVKCCVPTIDPSEVKLLSLAEKHWHQDRVPGRILRLFESNVLTLSLYGYTNFDDLFDYVAANCGLKNGKCLLTYDFCLRYGYDKGIFPSRFVYLFRGAKEGAVNLLGPIPNSVYKLPTTTFTSILGPMDSMDIENLLCVCSDHIKYL